MQCFMVTCMYAHNLAKKDEYNQTTKGNMLIFLFFNLNHNFSCYFFFNMYFSFKQ